MCVGHTFVFEITIQGSGWPSELDFVIDEKFERSCWFPDFFRPKNFRVSFRKSEHVKQQKTQLIEELMMTPSFANAKDLSTVVHMFLFL